MFIRSFMIAGVLVTSPMARADPPAKPRLDVHGFPLPRGAITRLGDLHFAQPDWIHGMALTADDKLLATTAGKQVLLWNPETGRIVRQIAVPHWSGPLAFSRNGQWLAVGVFGGEVRVWNVARANWHWVSATGIKDVSRPQDMRFVDNDRLLAVTFEKKGLVQLWDVANGTLARMWNLDQAKAEQLKNGYEFAHVGLSPSGSQMAWLVRPISTMRGPEKGVCCSVFLYDTLTGKFLREVKTGETLT
jgi:WD40 repeat protein